MLAASCIAAAYAAPAPVAVITDGAGGFTSLSEAYAVAIREISDRTYAFVASRDASGVQIIDITRPAEPLPVATVSDGAGGFTHLYRPEGIAIHDISGRTYAVVASGGDDGTQIIDVTRPAEPVPASSISYDKGVLGWAHSVAVRDISNGTYAVVVGDGGMQIVDITRPAEPVPVSGIPRDDIRHGLTMTAVAVHEAAGKTYAFVAGLESGICTVKCIKLGSVHVIDITHPAEPLRVAETGTVGWPRDIAVHEVSDRVYALVAGSDGVHILDITRPASPTAVTGITDDASWASSRYTELAGASGIAVHDMDNGTYAVVASQSDSGVQVVDVTRPGNPVPVAAIQDDAGGFTALGHARDVAVHDISGGTYALVVGDDGVQIMDLTDLTPAPPVHTPAVPHISADAITASMRTGALYREFDITVHDIGNRTYALTGSPSSVWVTDITQPDDPVPVAIFNKYDYGVDDFYMWDIAVHEISGRTYALVGSFGMQVLDITRPDDLLHVAAIPDRFGGSFDLFWNEIAVHDIGNRTYALAGDNHDNGVQIMDITHPDKPLPVATLSDAWGFTYLDGGGGVAVAKTHGRTYAVVTSSFNDNVRMIDMTDPASPVPVPLASVAASTGGFGGLNWANDVALDLGWTSGRIYAVVTGSFDDGVRIINVTDPELHHQVASLAAGPGEANYVGITGMSGRIYAVVADSFNDNVRIIDMTDPASPVLLQAASTAADLSWLSGPGVAVDMAVTQISNRTYAVVAGVPYGVMSIIDITDPASPVPVQAPSVPHRFNELFDEISWAGEMATVQISGKTYAVAVDIIDGSVRVTDVTDPELPAQVASVAGGPGWFAEPDGTGGVAIIQMSGRTYAVAAGSIKDDVFITDITDPASQAPVASITAGHGGFTELFGVRGIATHDIGNRTYAAVASQYDSGVQIIDITHPADPVPVAAISDDVGGFTELGGAHGIAIRDIGNRTYAAVASQYDSGVQIIDITHPADPVPVAAISDDVGGFTVLDEAQDITIHEISDRVYAFVAGDAGVQVIDITHPADPKPVAWLDGIEDVAVHDIGNRTYALVDTRVGVNIVDVTDLEPAR